MRWLLWKDYRANRLVLIVGAVLALLPYVILLVLLWGPLWRGSTRELSLALFLAPMYSLALSELTVALLGGNVIAGERADRSAEFLGYLPISRTKALASKLTLSLATIAVIWGVNLLVLSWAVAADVGGAARVFLNLDMAYIISFAALTGAMLFSVSWLLSSILESPTFSVCGGLITPVVIVVAISSTCWGFGLPEEVLGPPWYTGICLVLAPLCLVVGTWYYLRRVEP